MIHLGDLFDVLPTLPEASIDACVTDPPYGIGFMGREWDTFKPGTGKTRKLMHPRERIAAKIASENPNVNGRHRSPALSPSQIDYDYTVAGLRGFQEWTEKWAREVHRVLKPGAYLVVCGAPRSYHRMACGLEDAGFVIRDKFSWLFGQGFPKNYNLGDGKGTALKPAHEPIALAWKPFKGTIKACHMAHGTAALNIEACRIGDTVETWPKTRARSLNTRDMHHNYTGSGSETVDTGDAPSGRWPSNVLLDEFSAAALDEQTGNVGGNLGTAGGNVERAESAPGLYMPNCGNAFGYDDSGGASRFYYVAKPSREERDYGCQDLMERSGGEATYRKDGSAGLSNPRAAAGRTGGARNIHPTVKPVELMRWLVKLVTPIGGTVLDPFTGSGTTGMACAYELRPFVGIEREAEYVAIAERRIAQCVPLFGEATA